VRQTIVGLKAGRVYIMVTSLIVEQTDTMGAIPRLVSIDGDTLGQSQWGISS
jgi:hypothetical protein